MLYITQRKLQYAIYDICNGRKILDVAVDYGFETHAGFIKAFKKFYGCTPSHFRLHIPSRIPPRINVSNLICKFSGGYNMSPIVMEKESFTVVGFKSRHKLPNIKSTHDIPAFWNTINMDYGKSLSRLHHTFTNSKHCECSICFDTDTDTGEFTYLLGVGVDNNEDINKIESDMDKIDISGGMYAIFTTPLTESEHYEKSIGETWEYILTEWLPNSQYTLDETRYDFEYYDERDHAWEHDNKVQMDIYIPVIKK
jgi:AraC family transcriptional regulator